MLYIVAYDITHPKRLRRVAKICEDHGVRVEYSVFECRLEPELFEKFWSNLKDEICLDNDRLIAWKLDSAAANQTLTAGQVTCSSTHICYLV